MNAPFCGLGGGPCLSSFLYKAFTGELPGGKADDPVISGTIKNFVD